MGSHSFTCHTHTNPPAFTPQQQGVTVFWLVLIAPNHEGMTRHRELNPYTITHPSTNRARRRLTSLIETNARRYQTTTGDPVITCLIAMREIQGSNPTLDNCVYRKSANMIRL